MKFLRNKRTGKKYYYGSKANKVVSPYKRNKRTGEKVRYGAMSNIKYERKGLFGRKVVKTGEHKGDKYHKRIYKSYFPDRR